MTPSDPKPENPLNITMHISTMRGSRPTNSFFCARRPPPVPEQDDDPTSPRELPAPRRSGRSQAMVGGSSSECQCPAAGSSPGKCAVRPSRDGNPRRCSPPPPTGKTSGTATVSRCTSVRAPATSARSGRCCSTSTPKRSAKRWRRSTRLRRLARRRRRRCAGSVVPPAEPVQSRRGQPPHAPQGADRRRVGGLHRRSGHLRSVAG